ncbi:ion transporter [Halomonas sp. YLB-10]|nr:ion transporter [Halomonas sp.]MBY6110274.1 ion transporter [Halomonas sp. DP1Y21-3]RQW72029.1 ion transporter [Halomonas sp. YLB-10]|tara:strand:+ start:697 stop:1704 length:1008 start_codon:yes stop_codon:yes gene_type:complete
MPRDHKDTPVINGYKPAAEGLKTRIFQIIFESDTRLAKGFDIALITAILASVLVVVLESVDSLRMQYGELFRAIEWTFTILFTIELVLRLYCLERPLNYLKSFYGTVDLIAILPSWLALLIPGAQSLIVIRLLRSLRIFRILRLMEFVGEGRLLIDALKRSGHQIFLFLFTVFMLVTIFASMMYLIEPREAGFTSIPVAIYWAVVTLTTVGYGDISPVTPLGQAISVVVMLIGYSIIAVPTGVFSAEVIRSIRADRYSDEACPGCGHDRHEQRAKYCLICGTWLDEDTPDPNAPKEEPEEEPEDDGGEEKKAKREDDDDDGDDGVSNPDRSGPSV